MHTNESAEMYLESILVLTEKQGAVRAIDIAHYTGYSKPSISRAMGLLRNSEHITQDSAGYILLTEKGKQVAQKILERHRILTDVLIRLGVDEETAAEDACRIEHVIRDTSFEQIKKYMQN